MGENISTIPVNIRRGQKYDIYIGRSSKRGSRNILSNPYMIGPDGDRTEVLRKYAYDFGLRWRTEPEFQKSILECRGKKLGCFCKPESCHGDIIAMFLSVLEKSNEHEALSAVYSIANGEGFSL